MKGKIPKILRVAIALVLALSLGLVMAVPVAAASIYPQFLDVVADNVTTGEWSKTVEATTPQSGTNSYHVVIEDGNIMGLQIIHKYIYGPTGVGTMTLADINDMAFWEYVKVAGGTMQMGAGIILYMDMTGDGVWVWEEDAQIILESPYPDSPLVLDNIGKWAPRDIDDFAGFQKGTGSLNADYTGVDGVALHCTLTEWQASGYATLPVLWVGIVAGWGDYSGYDGYFDDFTINGDTYDLEPPISLDASYYQVGDTVTVTVMDPVANTNAAVQESVVVLADSSNPVNDILLGLLETGVNTGVFMETFTLVGTTPGTGELLVTQGSTVTVTYAALDPDATDTAEVDSAAPVVTITAPAEDGDFVAGATDITFSIIEVNLDTSSLTIDGLVVEDPTSPYTWDTAELDIEEEAVWPDGPYTIEVSATDLGGLVGSDSISVTVDNTDPVIADQEATPPVVEPDIENTIVFTAPVTDATSGVDTVTINLGSIGGLAAEPMLDDGLLSDVEADDGIYTVDITVTIAAEGTYTLTVTATDLAGLSATADITLVVSSDTVPPVITDAAITYLFVGVDSAQPGEDVIISANVTDDVGMGTVTAECDVITSGEPPVPLVIELLDDGEGDDATADDGIYTGTATVDSDAGWGDYPVTITATDAKGNEAIDETLILAVRSGATGVPIVLVKGWNLISLPLIPVDADITVVISATTLDSGDVSSVGTVVGYDPATGDFPRYMPGTGGALTEMEDGVGYWVFMEEADTLTITGREWPVPPEVPPVYSVVEGWNLIGVKSIHPILYSLYLGNLYEYDLPEFSVIWGYSAVAGRYFSVYPMLVVTDELFQGHGYWLWMKVDGTIVPPQ